MVNAVQSRPNLERERERERERRVMFRKPRNCFQALTWREGGQEEWRIGDA